MEEMLIKYNEKYDIWCRSDGKIFRQDKNGKFIECKQYIRVDGYLRIYCKKLISSHRLIWETLKGTIPPGYEIDHINTIREDNRLENLRCVTHKENCNNPITRKKTSYIQFGKTRSDFGKKFKNHFGISYFQDRKLYRKENKWYKRHNNKCSWE